MIRQGTGVCIALLLPGVLGGCGQQQLKKRLAMIENENRALLAQIGQIEDENAQLGQSREALNRQLQEAERHNADLRAKLAAMPEPGAEPAAAGWTAVPGGAMIAIDDSVLFAPGKAVLREQAQRTLDRIASAIQGQYADKDILVFGHTDNQPIRKSGWEDNWQLSAERALAVVRYLQNRGVAAHRLVAAGCGENRPRAANDSQLNRSANRRVEIFAIDPQSRTGRP